jgi:hypothetical protein
VPATNTQGPKISQATRRLPLIEAANNAEANPWLVQDHLPCCLNFNTKVSAILRRREPRANGDVCIGGNHSRQSYSKPPPVIARAVPGAHVPNTAQRPHTCHPPAASEPFLPVAKAQHAYLHKPPNITSKEAYTHNSASHAWSSNTSTFIHAPCGMQETSTHYPIRQVCNQSTHQTASHQNRTQQRREHSACCELPRQVTPHPRPYLGHMHGQGCHQYSAQHALSSCLKPSGGIMPYINWC